MSVFQKASLGLIALAAALAVPAHAQIGTIQAGYFASGRPTQMFFQIDNTSGFNYSDLKITETINDPTTPVTDTLDLGALTAGTHRTLTNDTDFPLTFGKDPANGAAFNTPFDVTFTAIVNGQTYSSTFNQDTNDTGGFVEFEGIPEGNVYAANDVPLTTVGHFSAVPEASTVAGFGVCLLGLGGLLAASRKRSA